MRRKDREVSDIKAITDTLDLFLARESRYRQKSRVTAGIIFPVSSETERRSL